MNKVILIGRLVREPEISEISGKLKIAKFTLAVQRKFKNEQGKYEADFINVVAWRKIAEIIESYVKKGSKIGVVGSLQVRTYEDKEGVRKYITEVIAEEIELIETKVEEPEPIDMSDLPF